MLLREGKQPTKARYGTIPTIWNPGKDKTIERKKISSCQGPRGSDEQVEHKRVSGRNSQSDAIIVNVGYYVFVKTHNTIHEEEWALIWTMDFSCNSKSLLIVPQ